MMNAQQLDRVFAALADSTRRAIVARLASGGATVSELAEPFRMSQPAISKHLKILQSADLISSQVDGPRRPRELKVQPLIQAVLWIERYQETWEKNYAKLDNLLQELQSSSQQKRKKAKKIRRAHEK